MFPGCVPGLGGGKTERGDFGGVNPLIPTLSQMFLGVYQKEKRKENVLTSVSPSIRAIKDVWPSDLRETPGRPV